MSNSVLVEIALPSLTTLLMYSKCSAGNMSFICRRMVLATSVGNKPFGLFFDPLGRPAFLMEPGAVDPARLPSVLLGVAFCG